ncbi:MAG: carbohydrate ABC transporter permease, partial [Sphaerochaeta sp.]
MKQKHLATIATYVFLCVVCLFSVFPFYFMIVGSTNLSVDIVKGRLFFGTHLIENFKTLASTVKLGNAFWNSLRNALANTVASLFVCSLAGYGFQIYRDKGKDTLMGLLLLSMM